MRSKLIHSKTPTTEEFNKLRASAANKKNLGKYGYDAINILQEENEEEDPVAPY